MFEAWGIAQGQKALGDLMRRKDRVDLAQLQILQQG